MHKGMNKLWYVPTMPQKVAIKRNQSSQMS